MEFGLVELSRLQFAMTAMYYFHFHHLFILPIHLTSITPIFVPLYAIVSSWSLLIEV